MMMIGDEKNPRGRETDDILGFKIQSSFFLLFLTARVDSFGPLETGVLGTASRCSIILTLSIAKATFSFAVYVS